MLSLAHVFEYVIIYTDKNGGQTYAGDKQILWDSY